MYQTLDYWSRDMINYNFSEKDLELVSPLYFVYDFSKKTFLLLHSINWPIFIVWLPLLLEILGNMFITINIFLIKPFCYMTKKSRHCLYFSKYWATCLLRLISFLSSRFATWTKSQDKSLNILRTKRAFDWNKKHFSLLLKNVQLLKIVSDLRVRL